LLFDGLQSDFGFSTVNDSCVVIECLMNKLVIIFLQISESGSGDFCNISCLLMYKPSIQVLVQNGVVTEYYGLAETYSVLLSYNNASY
jgi:hypothetical protein